ncbi:hypothetical protein MKX01_021893, partial [Papaver californicum]
KEEYLSILLESQPQRNTITTITALLHHLCHKDDNDQKFLCKQMYLSIRLL